MNETTQEALVEIRGLCRHFRTEAEDLVILSDLDLRLERGGSLAIMGASGSGKSTLLSLVGGLDRPDGGYLRAGDRLLHELDEGGLAEYRGGFVGFVFQFHFLIKDLSALENVALPAMMRGEGRGTAFARARELLVELGLGSRLDHLPSKLSGGERQRAAIARALVNSPPLLLADEPTGNLDAANAQAVRELLLSLPARYGTTLLVVTHDPVFASAAGACLVLEEGRLRTP